MPNEKVRPPIPAEMRRAVLIEAGHRCAIHTCRHPEVDVHHIEQWSRVQEHRLENLIALCPNCHRRADRGEIDRLALIQYKARLTAAVRANPGNTYPTERGDIPSFSWLDPQARWKPLLRQQHDPVRGFGSDLEYPEFSGGLPEARSLNALILSQITGAVTLFGAENVYDEESIRRRADFDNCYTCQFNSSFVVTFLSHDFVSVRFTYFGAAGGAHGFRHTGVVNAYLQPFEEVQFRDLFTDNATGLRRVSEYAIRRLLEEPIEGKFYRNEDSVRRGAEPKPENFKAFNLTPLGLLITFDEYQVGPYAEGYSEVVTPWNTLRQLLTERARAVIGT